MSKNKKQSHQAGVKKNNQPGLLKEKIKHSVDFFEDIIGNKIIYLVLGIIIIIGIYIFKDYLVFDKLYIFKDIGSDTYNQFIPYFIHNAEYLRTDGIPMWSFHTGMGQNIFPGILNSPFYFVFGLFTKDTLGFSIVYIEFLKILLAGFFFFYYLRTVGFSRYSSLIGALLFSFSGYMIVGGGWYGYSIIGVCVSFLLLSFEKLFVEKKYLFFPIAVALLSHSAFETYTYGLFLLIYSFVRFVDKYDWDWKKYGILVLQMGGLGLIGVMINAALIVSPIIQMIQSPRVSGASGHFQSLKTVPWFSLDNFSTQGYGYGLPYHHIKTVIMRMFSSDLLGTGSGYRGWYNYLEAPMFYSGLITLLLVPSVFSFLDKKHKRIFGLFLGLWVIIVVFPFFRYAYTLFAGDYYKVGLSLIVTLVLIFYGIKSLDFYSRGNKIKPLWLILTYVGLLLLLFIPSFPEQYKILNKDLRFTVAVYLTVYTVLLYAMNNDTFRNTVKILLLLVLIFELASLSYISTNKRQTMTRYEIHQRTGFNDYTIDALNYIRKTDSSFYRVNKMFFSGTAIHTSFNDAQIQGYYGTPNYASFNQLNYINFLAEMGIIRDTVETETRWAIGLVNRPLLQIMASVKYNIVKQNPGGFYQFGYDSVARFGDVLLQRNKYFLPFGFTYDKVITHQVFKHISVPRRELIVMKAAIADDHDSAYYTGLSPMNLNDTLVNYTFDILAADVQKLKSDTLVIFKHKQNLISGTISLPAKKVLFFSIPYDKGWKAYVNGVETELKKVNIGFMGLLLDKGNYKIELRFMPLYFKESIMISIGGILIYVGLLIEYFIRKRKNNLNKISERND